MEHKKNKKTTTQQTSPFLQVTPSPKLNNEDKTLSKRDIQIEKALEKKRLSTKE